MKSRRSPSHCARLGLQYYRAWNDDEVLTHAPPVHTIEDAEDLIEGLALVIDAIIKTLWSASGGAEQVGSLAGAKAELLALLDEHFAGNS